MTDTPNPPPSDEHSARVQEAFDSFHQKLGDRLDSGARESVEKLRDAEANLRGYVLNGVPADARLAAYYDNSAGEYGKGVYGAEEIVAITEAPNHAKAGAH